MNARSRTVRSALLVLAAVGASLAASLLVTAWLPIAPRVHERDFRMLRGEEDAYEVRPGHPLVVPLPFGDFDLTADVELAENTDLDVAVREVEPVLREHGMPLFHARYSAVRASTGSSGEPSRTREEALFERFEEGGVRLGAGRVATIQLEARGRVVQGNVAGIPIEAFRTTDAHGGIAVVSHRGFGLVRQLVVHHVPRPLALLPIGYAAIGGVVLGVLLAALGRSTRRSLASLVAVPVIAWLGSALILGHLLPESEPDTLAVVLVVLAGAPMAVAFACSRPLIAALGGTLVVLLAFELTTRLERDRLFPFEDPRLSACFGWGSSSMPFDVLVPRLRARAEVHVPDGDRTAVFFLGGGTLYEGGVDREDWVGPLAAFAAQQRLGKPIDGVVVPTLYSSAYQQLELFRRFCVEPFAPRAAVFAVPPWEGEASEPWPPRAAMASEIEPWDGSGSALWALWRAGRAAPAPTSDAEGLARTLRAFDDLARDRGIAAVFVSSVGLRPDLHAVVVRVAEERGRELLVLDFESDTGPVVVALTDWLVEALRD